jgi:hypothetical protein
MGKISSLVDDGQGFGDSMNNDPQNTRRQSIQVRGLCGYCSRLSIWRRWFEFVVMINSLFD